MTRGRPKQKKNMWTSEVQAYTGADPGCPVGGGANPPGEGANI